MFHLILLLPIIALLLFWILPPAISVPVYLVIAAASALLYWKILRSMRQPATTGVEDLVNSLVEVTSVIDSGSGKYMVRVQGELWEASGVIGLHRGESARIKAVDGLQLTLKPVDNDSSQGTADQFPDK